MLIKTKLLLYVAGIAALLTLTRCFYSDKQNEGEQLYTQNCANCHMDDGSGLRNLIPPLAGADYLENHRDELACIIQHGQTGNIVVNGKNYNQGMPGFEHLKPGQITNILNYVQTNFGNNNPRFSIQEVEKQLFKCRHLLEH
ncbi:cytochrome c [Pontibacter sp. BT731]|uniref:c-type cytochrome n=1 Tax=Pontibacter coccineus TaxID=3063328 RepID=UPI0026E47AF7|nr:cytochrome c [Pontibacter sp. BT731]MDO6391649.1 cytochrome c [Pontibacter sp. BT731]